jgi:hypothetical protein
MSVHDPQDQELVRTIQGAWAPAAPDAEAFDARLRARLRGQQRRRVALGVAVAVAGVLVAASHLLGGPAPAPVEVVQAPAEPAPVVAVAELADSPVFFSQALDHDQRGFSLPGAYGALDTLFLQAQDQEL